MSELSDRGSREFLKVCGQFKLGALVTESSHPVTANLSEVAKQDIAKALKLLFEVDQDVLRKYREFVDSGRAVAIKEALLKSLKGGGRIFFTGCGSTGRLSIQLVSIWRDFWQQRRAQRLGCPPAKEDWEHRALSVMAGGDFALIKSVEGFEDFAAFGEKQLGDWGVSSKDVVFAITEGGETSFVIGTAWKGIEVGAKVYFVYNNSDEILCEHVQRSREVIEEPRIEKLNLTTGPMAITGSTRMQATTIQLGVLLTILEMVLRDLLEGVQGVEPAPDSQPGQGSATLGRTPEPSSVPQRFLAGLEEMLATLHSAEVLSQLAGLVALEESVYRHGHKNNYYADRLGMDVLTDTTERSPTYCTPPFRKFDDPAATESWSFLFLPCAQTPHAWERILKREPRCIEWSEADVRALVAPEKLARTLETVGKISRQELMRFKIGLDGIGTRQLSKGDSAIGILIDGETDFASPPARLLRGELEAARKSGAALGLVCFPRRDRLKTPVNPASVTPQNPLAPAVTVTVPLPQSDLWLDGVARVGVKMLLNVLSTCTMVRLGRVMGNFMIWVVPSNLKLIDRATRYVQKLASVGYEEANRMLFEVIEYVEPRMKADQAYPPVVGLAVMRIQHNLTNPEAERRLVSGLDP